MSHRRKEKNVKKEEASKPKLERKYSKFDNMRLDRDEPVKPEAIPDLIMGFLDTSDSNYTCDKCGCKEHDTLDGEYGAVSFRCLSCGCDTNIVMPCFLGESNDHIIGFQVTEITNDPKAPLKLHYLGGWQED